MGGSSGGGGGSAPAIQTQIVREAPGIEERKIGLMDIGLNLGATPVNIPQFQVAQPTALRTTRISTSWNYRCRCSYSSTRYCFITSWSRCNITSITRTKYKSIF
jgi:hypothetical protein